MSAIKVYPCPKCSALADITYIAEPTEQEWERYTERVVWRDGKPLGHRLMMNIFTGSYLNKTWLGHEYGEHLDAECPRCKHMWREPVLS